MDKFYKAALGKAQSLNLTLLVEEKDYKGVKKQQYNFKCNNCEDVFRSTLDYGNKPWCKKCNPKPKGHMSKFKKYEGVVDFAFIKDLYEKTVTEHLERKIQKFEIEDKINEFWKYDVEASWAEKLYCIVNDINPLCDKGNHKKYDSMLRDFRFCSRHCACDNENQSNKLKAVHENRTDEEKQQILEKMQETSMEKYGFKNPSQHPDVKQKQINTLIERFGIDYKEVIREKMKTTCRERYRVDFPWEVLSEMLEMRQDALQSYLVSHGIYTPTHRSWYENEMKTWFKEWGVNFKQNDRTIVKPREIDFVFPDHKLAIEFCGLYYHSEKAGNKDMNYHYDKFLKCEEQGYQLLTIFSDEWHERYYTLRNMLQSRLQLSSSGIGARKMTIQKITKKATNEFLERTHIQGSEPAATIHLGAFYQSDLKGVMTFGKNYNSGEWELKRYASDGHNPGMASKLFNHYIKEYNPESIMSYSDNRWTTGNLYKTLGFKKIKDVKPSYFYVEDYLRRHHRSKFTKKNIRKRWNISESVEFTERQFMFDAGFDRIWDCGNKKWLWTQ